MGGRKQEKPAKRQEQKKQTRRSPAQNGRGGRRRSRPTQRKQNRKPEKEQRPARQQKKSSDKKGCKLSKRIINKLKWFLKMGNKKVDAWVYKWVEKNNCSEEIKK